jgi:hypothetical protein
MLKPAFLVCFTMPSNSEVNTKWVCRPEEQWMDVSWTCIIIFPCMCPSLPRRFNWCLSICLVLKGQFHLQLQNICKVLNENIKQKTKHNKSLLQHNKSLILYCNTVTWLNWIYTRLPLKYKLRRVGGQGCTSICLKFPHISWHKVEDLGGLFEGTCKIRWWL